MPRVIASVEARMQSSRLPGKILADIEGQPNLSRMVRRLRGAATLDDIIVATSTNPADDAVEEWAEAEGVAVHRGSEEDVLRRVVGAQRAMDADIVVEICGDCPLIDPEVVDLAVETFQANDCDVVTTTQVESWPDGTDAQVFPLELLADVEGRIDDPAVREHVSLYFYEHPEQYRVLHLLAPRRLRLPGVRLQLDYPEDLRFIREVYSRLEPARGPLFGIPEIVALLREEPELAEINRHCEERPVR